MKNIKLAYVLAYLNASWFWLGIWVPYYLKFTNYAGIGLLESIMIITSTTTEIPTGAVADLLGKKKTLFLAFIFAALGNFIMGTTPNFFILACSIFIMTTGGSLYSGTLEALVYDSLKQHNQHQRFDKIVSNTQSLRNVAFAISGAIGGFLYTIAPGLPFIAVGLAYSIGSILCLFLQEPSIDSETFSLSNYLKQTKQGFQQLIKSPKISRTTAILTSTAFFVVIGIEVLNDIQVYEYHYIPEQLGIISSAMFLVAAFGSQLTLRAISFFGRLNTIFLTGLAISLSLIFSSFAPALIGTALIAIRWATQSIFENTSSTIINHNTESKYRATTISTYQVIIKFPYVLSAYFIGSIIDKYTSHNLAFGLGLGLLFVVIVQYFFIRPSHD